MTFLGACVNQGLLPVEALFIVAAPYGAYLKNRRRLAIRVKTSNHHKQCLENDSGGATGTGLYLIANVALLLLELT